MENIQANEPAFPIDSDELSSVKLGLSKREYFAAMVMQGMAANPAMFELTSEKINPTEVAAFYANAAVEQADALIKALNQQPDN
jgi:hypothetical protein